LGGKIYSPRNHAFGMGMGKSTSEKPNHPLIHSQLKDFESLKRFP
jgi:hypothetical protein